ncbi:hypothetical protein [Vibrio sp.]|uniref:hypothetical protein n=1 Tax=Vibrio sp. TaxID=678 RepID=UPI00311DFF8C
MSPFDPSNTQQQVTSSYVAEQEQKQTIDRNTYATAKAAHINTKKATETLSKTMLNHFESVGGTTQQEMTAALAQLTNARAQMKSVVDRLAQHSHGSLDASSCRDNMESLKAQGFTQKEIAESYNCSQTYVSNVLNKKI